MKKAFNFRFNQKIILILALLEKKLHTTKTAIVEEALEFYAEKKLHSNNPLMRHAGVLSEQDADAMLVAIKRDRRNKNIKVKL